MPLKNTPDTSTIRVKYAHAVALFTNRLNVESLFIYSFYYSIYYYHCKFVSCICGSGFWVIVFFFKHRTVFICNLVYPPKFILCKLKKKIQKLFDSKLIISMPNNVGPIYTYEWREIILIITDIQRSDPSYIRMNICSYV